MIEGLAQLEKLKVTLQRIPVEAILLKIAKRNEAIIEDKNIAQLDAGLDAHGNKIEPPYSPFTVAYKKSIGAVFNRVTLEDTGAFRKSIKSKETDSGVSIFATDSKWGELTEKYGDVVGLSEKSIEELSKEVFQPEFLEELNNYFDTV